MHFHPIPGRVFKNWGGGNERETSRAANAPLLSRSLTTSLACKTLGIQAPKLVAKTLVQMRRVVVFSSTPIPGPREGGCVKHVWHIFAFIWQPCFRSHSPCAPALPRPRLGCGLSSHAANAARHAAAPLTLMP